MNKIIKKMAAIGMGVFWSISACGAVIENLSERDWLSGDGALTYDESTGLEWLDINLTSRMSLSQIYSSGILNVFRWATSWEIESLLDAALVGFNNRQSNNIDDNNNAMRWMNYLGMTGGEIELRWSQGYTLRFDSHQGNGTVLQMYGVSAVDCAVAIINYGSCGGSVNVNEGEPIYASGADVFATFDEVIATSSWGFTGPGGAMLVRETFSVDAPGLSVLSMLVLVFSGVGFSRKTKKSNYLSD